MSLINNTGENPEITADTKAGVTIVNGGDSITVATNNLGDGTPVEGTYDKSKPIKEVEEDLKRKSGRN